MPTNMGKGLDGIAGAERGILELGHGYKLKTGFIEGGSAIKQTRGNSGTTLGLRWYWQR
ncbi:hypothetical protein COMA1_11361 [Candidatus Nitrospira nitrosa]|uniref:Autotransporter domain-containing protein n=1 Tax=Candidatus Nitrospira nitrosa TaxID=1742972 RepID=A0A0S4LFD4_9BACT|nr:hypothetical protein COMA1_11361 [Candidatus Nitrospira nitrosa]